MSNIKYQPAQYFSWGVVLLAIFMFQFNRAELFELLRYEREGIIDGEYWRLFSAHFIHLSWGHSWLNLVGYVLIISLLGRYLSIGLFFLTIIFSCLLIDIGLFVLHKDIQWYAGFSGVLHGLFVAGLIFVIKIARTPWAKWMLALLSLKLFWELFSGSLPGAEQLSGGKVIVEAHFYGAAGGLIASLILMRKRSGSSTDS